MRRNTEDLHWGVSSHPGPAHHFRPHACQEVFLNGGTWQPAMHISPGRSSIHRLDAPSTEHHLPLPCTYAVLSTSSVYLPGL